MTLSCAPTRRTCGLAEIVLLACLSAHEREQRVPVMNRSCTTYYLEMTSASDLQAKPQRHDLQIIECEVPQALFNKFLYQLVGASWEWGDLDTWHDADWQALVEQDCHRTWVAYHRGAIAGYYELYRPDGRNSEIRYFGLAPQFIGCGFGGRC